MWEDMGWIEGDSNYVHRHSPTFQPQEAQWATKSTICVTQRGIKKLILAQAERVVLTREHWSLMCKHSYLGVSAHLIDNLNADEDGGDALSRCPRKRLPYGSAELKT
jgi:hypothetical protein